MLLARNPLLKRFLYADRRFKHNNVYDFRSDTMTAPSADMLAWSFKHASRGDDVFQEDDSTKELEETLADMTGHEAGLFCVSGTMTNQLALRCHLNEIMKSVLLDSRSHIYKYENAGIAFHSQSGTTPVPPLTGKTHLTLDRIKAYRLHPDVHVADTSVICLENTLNGMIFPENELAKISEYARKEGIIMHLDGARVWNAAAEQGVGSLKSICSHFDSVSLCLSKGIGAPVGSVLVGSPKVIALARHCRKLFGGGWRQSGVLASMAMCALKQSFSDLGSDGRPRLCQDHDNAKWLSKELVRRWPGIEICNPVETNMLFVDVRNMIGTGDVKVADLVSNAHSMFENSNDIVRLPTWGYTFDRGDGRGNVDDDYVMRLVLHNQVPREGCVRLLESFDYAVKNMSENKK